MKHVDNSKAPRQQTMFFETMKEISLTKDKLLSAFDLLDKRFYAFSIEILNKLNVIDEQLRMLVSLTRSEATQTSAGAAAEWFVSQVPSRDLPPSLLEKLEKTEDGGLKLKVGLSKENFHAFNAQMWDQGYKYVPKKGWYPR